ncbi:DUF6063 family protein [Peribacillus frigoritolerans]|uniref:DUF6063 family protein n=1 Tax=Peribacillus castrilensis TaxID=2897690 RepID=A0AAW9NJ19_9BACI|nr:DUF6063 family protein [Peribacillus castrilensis]
MNESQIQTAVARLYFSLLDNKYLPINHELVIPYLDHQEVRACLKRFADVSGVKISMQSSYLHMLVQPNNCIYSSSISQMKSIIKTYESRVDLYIMGVIWMVLFSETDTEMSTKIRWENEGISYQKIVDLTTKTLNHWKEKNNETNGQFSDDWSLAIDQMFKKWRLLIDSKKTNEKIVYTKNTRFGVIDIAMKQLEKDKMVIIRRFNQTSIITPVPVFYERLNARFHNMDKIESRYNMIKALIDDIKVQDEAGA